MTTQTAKNRSEATSRRALYAVVRYVPNILRGEFVNVAVLVVVPGTREWGLEDLPSYGDGSRAKLLPGSDGMFIRHAVSSLRDLLRQQSEEPWTEERLSALCAMYAANNVQLSPLRSAAAANVAALSKMLFSRFVETPTARVEKPKRGKGIIREKVRSIFATQRLFELGLKEELALPIKSKAVVDMAYKNGVWHCYQSIPFDVDERLVTGHVNAYRQTARDARASENADLSHGVFAVFTNDQGNQTLRDDLVGLMEEEGLRVYGVDDAPQVAESIAADLRAHSEMRPLNA